MGARALMDCVGLTRLDEDIYLRLLADPGSTVEELGRRLETRPSQVQDRLAALAALGLVCDGVKGWRATAPDIALEALVRGREAELMKLRGRVEDMMRGYRHNHVLSEPNELVEVVSGREAVAACWHSLQAGAGSTLRVLDKAPHIRVASAQEETAVLRRGVRVEVIYEHAAVRTPAALAAIRSCMALGEQARMLPAFPFKMALVDDRWALLPVNTGTALECALLVRPSTLLDALSSLFASYWSQAMRIPRGEPDGSAGKSAELADPQGRRRELLTLLAAGLTDEGIARQLGISTRTVQRLIREFMDACGARTRFQAGVQAAREEFV